MQTKIPAAKKAAPKKNVSKPVAKKPVTKKPAPAPENKPAAKPVIIKKIVTTIEQDKQGIQKRTTTTYNAPKSAPKKPAPKNAVPKKPSVSKKKK